jgi:TolB-like protein
MKSFAVWFLSFCLLLLLPLNVSADFKKTKIAVLDFQLQGDSFENQDLGAIVAEWFITSMVKEGRFDVVERRLLQKIISEQKLAMTGLIDTSSATQLGKLLGVKVIISGSVMKLKNMVEINARIIDVESASIIAAENVRSSRNGNLQALGDEMSRKIIKNFPLEGYIVNRHNDTIIMDLGIRTGVKPGMKFIVFKEGQVIKHPKTGEVLDVERIETGLVTITEVRNKICKARIEEEKSPGSIQYGQLVKSIIEQQPEKPRLYIATIPENCRIRILNIGPRYKQGMILKPGTYHVEVSANGYKKQTRWITIDSGKEKHITIILQPAEQAAFQPETVQVQSPPPKRSRSRLSAQESKYIKMLRSDSLRSKRDAAKRITRAALSNTAVLDVVENELLKGYGFNLSNRSHVDTMAWFCKALGASGVQKYKHSLKKVVSNTSNRKLRGYCRKSLNNL